MLYVFSQENAFYFNKISGAKHFDFEENGIFYEFREFQLTATKEKILKNTIQILTSYLQNEAICKNISFPELILPIQTILKNFKKACENSRF